RKIDTIGRWGGDEFVCVVPHTDGEELDVLAERLRVNVRRLQIDLDENRRIRPSLSIGTATIRPGDTTDSLIARADLAMYENKRLVKAACYVRVNTDA
ncbi:MAG TPA: GGDEF domain-containing protein, partial [Myxococcota bacterium]|nr:GGDEF domain-containing protein [Myxococcota bacterium]